MRTLVVLGGLSLASCAADTAVRKETEAPAASHDKMGSHDMMGSHDKMGGSSPAGQGDASSAVMAGKPAARAMLEPRSGSQVSGTAEFFDVPGDTVRVVVTLKGLTPGSHGIHVHEKGDCSAADASSAGPHWNPTGAPHGAPSAASHHMGDFGNLEADAQGNAHFILERPDALLSGATSAIGKAVIIHEKVDDLATQPSGNAGGRVACGVIAAP